MLSWKKSDEVGFWKGFCLSTDTKPTQKVKNGACLIEMDTGKVYFFDAAGGDWIEFGGSAQVAGDD